MLTLMKSGASSVAACLLATSLASSSAAFAFQGPHRDPFPTHRGLPVRQSAADAARSRSVWTPLKNRAPFSASTALSMTDGTILVQAVSSSAWFRLTPDKKGSYIDGTWTQVASLPTGYAPLYYSSAVLPDGRLLVNGGEYNNGRSAETNLGAIYDPLKNTWTAVAPPTGWQTIGDAPNSVLADGTLLMGQSYPSKLSVLFDAKTSTWTSTGNGKVSDDAEEGYTLLPSGKLLTIDVIASVAQQTEIYDPATGLWSVAAKTANELADLAQSEIGAQVLRTNGTVFVEGGNGNTGIYNVASGTWAAGPTFPVVNGKQMFVDDGPAAPLLDGNVLCVASPSDYGNGSNFYEFNGTSLVPVPGVPSAPSSPSYAYRMLVLPNGQILMTDGSSDVEVYTHNGKPHPSLAPTIDQVSNILKRGSTYPLTGVHLNGFTQGATYGDDAQMASNYPLVRITNAASGDVFYARTHDHSSMAVASPATVSTMVDIPAGIETGMSSLVVVANGIASKPVSVRIK